MPDHAATWIMPSDETDRGNQLGAANVAAERAGRLVATIVEGGGEREVAVTAGRETGLLILPELHQVLPEPGSALELLQQARTEDWRLMLLSLGIDSDSGDVAEQILGRGKEHPSPPPEVASPMPPAALRRRVSVGTEDAFLSSGAFHVDLYDASLTAVGAPLAAATDILDWGAGCGRMTIFIKEKAPGARITAADTDPEAIAWIGENLGLAAAVALPLLPPTELPGDAFDRVVGHSIFTHLEVEPQDRWLEELARVARPDAYLAVSFNGPISLRWHRGHPLAAVPESVAEETEREGIAIWRGDGWEEEFYEGYHTTFHTHEYIRDHWGQWFDVVAIDEAAAAPIQDIAVLRPR